MCLTNLIELTYWTNRLSNLVITCRDDGHNDVTYFVCVGRSFPPINSVSSCCCSRVSVVVIRFGSVPFNFVHSYFIRGYCYTRVRYTRVRHTRVRYIHAYVYVC